MKLEKSIQLEKVGKAEAMMSLRSAFSLPIFSISAHLSLTLLLVYDDHRTGPPRPLILVVAFIFIDYRTLP
jgi:hypothetical protein